MTQEEFCKLTGIAHISGADFAVIHTLYMAAGGMGKTDFCEDFKNILIKERMPIGFEEDKGRCFFHTPLWASEVANTIERLEAETARLRATVKDLEERKQEDAKEKEKLAYKLRLLGAQFNSIDLKKISEKLCGAEFTARKAILYGVTLTENEERCLVGALEELDEYRRQKVTREGERPDAAAAAGADS